MFFKHVTKFVLEEMKAKWEEGGRRIVLGDDKGSGTVTLWPIRFHCVKIKLLLDYAVYTHTHTHTHIYVSILTHCSYCGICGIQFWDEAYNDRKKTKLNSWVKWETHPENAENFSASRYKSLDTYFMLSALSVWLNCLNIFSLKSHVMCHHRHSYTYVKYNAASPNY